MQENHETKRVSHRDGSGRFARSSRFRERKHSDTTADETVLTVDDPSGDNTGNGNLTIPLADGFYDGVWDLEAFRLKQDSSRVYFEFEMAAIENPFGGPRGWSHEWFQVYIRDPSASSGGSQGISGLGANFTDPYQYRVLAAPFDSPALQVQDGSGGQVSTDVNASLDGTTVTVDVPKSAVGGDPTDKLIAPLVTPHDGTKEDNFRGIAESAGDYTIGGPTDHPKVMDMVVPESTDQSSALTKEGIGSLKLPYVDVDQYGGSEPEPPSGENPTIGNSANPAQNTDDDPYLEDVDGDGDTDVFDAITYYNNRESDAIQNNPGLFNFDGQEPTGTVFDALELYNKIS